MDMFSTLIQIYSGSESKTKEKGLGYRVVMDFMEPYFHLFIDNFYISIKLLIDLFAKGTYCAGTSWSNRKYFPMKIIPSKGTESTDIQPGSFYFAVGKEMDSSLQHQAPPVVRIRVVVAFQILKKRVPPVVKISAVVTKIAPVATPLRCHGIKYNAQYFCFCGNEASKGMP